MADSSNTPDARIEAAGRAIHETALDGQLQDALSAWPCSHCEAKAVVALAAADEISEPAVERLVAAQRALIQGILEDPLRHEWTLQGFGMLRTYFSDRVRLQVWDHTYELPGCNSVHDHPWDFRSTIVAGVLRNQRFLVDHEPPHPTARRFYCQRIRPGMDAIEHGEPVLQRLWQPGVETYVAGDSYEQTATELHRTDYDDGTVTLIVRERVAEQDLAWSCWPADDEGAPPWQLFQVREATDDEVLDITSRSLRRWFDPALAEFGEQPTGDERG